MTEKIDTEKIKIKLYRLHFLLTEPESEEVQGEGIKQFKMCFKEVLRFLATYLQEEFGITTNTNLEVLSSSFEKKLFTQNMTTSLNEMEHDFRSLKSSKNTNEIYKRIKSIHAHHLQVIYDMLTRMGEDPEEE